MMMLNPMRLRLVATTLLLGSAALATGCSTDDQTPFGGNPASADLKIGLEVSSGNVKPGDRIAVAVRTAAAEPLQGLQGHVRFDPGALTYIGQPADETSLALVNDAGAARGDLRAIAVDVKGLPARPITLVFEVKNASFSSGLGFEFEAAARGDVEIRKVELGRTVALAADLAVPAKTERLDRTGWMRRLDPAAYDREFGLRINTPGQYLLNLRYGNVTRDASNAINVLDVVAAANVSVGASALIDSTAKDVVIAGNVRPVNGGTGGTPRPGVEPANAAAPDGQINVTDVVAIANAAVGTTVAVVGDLVPGRGPVTGNRVIINANITADRTFFKDTVYQIGDATKGDIVVTGATLTIQPGTLLEGYFGTQVYTGGIGSGQGTLIIARDGRIVAQGSALEPIVMTCQLPTLVGPRGQAAGTRWPGCWGGLILSGNATINADSKSTVNLVASPVVAGRSTGGCIQEADEFSNDATYGGCNDADSSGVLQYLRVEYGGARFTPTKERNGITFNGVGSGTVVDHIQSHASLDDATEYFGGTVNVKYVYNTGMEDDGFDWVLGYRGKAQFVIVQEDSTNGDRCFEMDNNGIDGLAGQNADATPRSNPQIYNVTCVGKRDAVRYSSTTGLPGTCDTQLNSSAVPQPNCVNQAFIFRQNTAGIIKNAIAYRYAVGLDFDAITSTPNPNAGSAFGLCSNFPLLQNTIISLANAVLPPGASGGVSVAGDPDASDPNSGGVCGPYTLTGAANLEALYIADVANNITVFNGGDVNGDYLVDPLNVIAPDFRPKAGSAPTTLPVATVPADPFFTSASYIGAVAPVNGGNIPWYSGWTRGYVSATGGPFAGWPQK
jgi:hypothetical protein